MLEKITEFMVRLFTAEHAAFQYYTLAVRFLIPLLALVVLERCVRSLLREKYDGEEWGCLLLPNGGRITLFHWENIIGRSRATDALLDYPTVSRNHAALIRDAQGSWRIYDLKSKTGVSVNGREIVESVPVQSGDVISLGGVEMTFVAISKRKEREQALRRHKPGRMVSQGGTLWFLTLLQILLCVQLCVSAGADFKLQLPASFFLLTGIMWVCYLFTRIMRRVAFEVETITFFLCTVGMAVCATSTPGAMFRQIMFLLCGLVAYYAIGFFLRDLNRAKKASVYIAAAGLALLAVNVVFSKVSFGARNWLEIGGFSFQPSEFVKLTFVMAGAATLDKMFARKNLFVFIAFAAVCVMALALISDFGTALVFFVSYLIIAFLRSGDFATVFLSIGGTVLAGFVAISARPYIAQRFATWGKVWLFPNDGGYQQARTMSALASGGLFGVGGGNGWLKHIFAADTDMVFGVVSEELGLIVGLLCIAALLILTFFVIRSSATARSSFFVIGACAALAMMLTQVILNVLGCLDILPFTGVTFPFVSKGGSSLIACWGLMAFVKSSDTRQNASFTVKAPKRVRVGEFDPIEDYENIPEYDDDEEDTLTNQDPFWEDMEPDESDIPEVPDDPTRIYSSSAEYLDTEGIGEYGGGGNIVDPRVFDSSMDQLERGNPGRSHEKGQR